MNIKQVIFINISFFISLTVLAADRPTQPVRTEVYRLERLDSVLLVDLAVDLTGVHRRTVRSICFRYSLRRIPVIRCLFLPLCSTAPKAI